MAVFRTLRFRPMSLVTQEISKAKGFLIKSIPQEGKVNVGQVFELGPRHNTSCLLKKQVKDERKRVIFCVIAVGEVWHIEDRMLENSRVVGHSNQVIQLLWRQLVGPL